MSENFCGLKGIDFVEFTSPEPEKLHQLFLEFGFSLTHKHKEKKIDLYKQNDITFLVNKEKDSFAWHFSKLHGPSACAMGWRFENANNGHAAAIKRGAKNATKTDFHFNDGKNVPAIMGIGDSLIYFIDNFTDPKRYEKMGFIPHEKPIIQAGKGFTIVDHLTNNVEKGTMQKWAEFYKSIFGFYEIRYFDIRGNQTGLTSFALRSPDGSFCIPINEADDHKSQINEYLREYNGPGIQHIAFLTDNILDSLKKMEGTGVRMLDIDSEYYANVFNRVPNVKEDHKEIQKRNVLVDGDDKGYLLQIFTQNIIGPIFIEIIQRHNNLTFGEGNFTALFRAIERDQEKRGVFKS